MFDYFVSLGPRCITAASMSKYGLRAFSGPFDWLIAKDFSWVLHFLKTDFDGFLQQENLEPYHFNKLDFDGSVQQGKFKQIKIYPKNFVDKSCGFLFLHDTEDYRTDFDALKQKYDRRINRLIALSSKKICFLRAVENQQELDYIQNYADEIQSIIKKKNQKSEIVFLTKNDLLIPEGMPFRCYRIPGVYGTDAKPIMRSWFDHANDFLEFCGQNYSGLSMIRNIAVDHEQEDSINKTTEHRYETLTALLFHNFSKDIFSEKTIIYGAGALGQQLFLKIQHFTEVVCFLDRSKGGWEFQGVPVFSLGALERVDGAEIIVSTAYDFDTIKASICEKYGETKIISIDEILNLKF